MFSQDTDLAFTSQFRDKENVRFSLRTLNDLGQLRIFKQYEACTERIVGVQSWNWRFPHFISLFVRCISVCTLARMRIEFSTSPTSLLRCRQELREIPATLERTLRTFADDNWQRQWPQALIVIAMQWPHVPKVAPAVPLSGVGDQPGKTVPNYSSDPITYGKSRLEETVYYSLVCFPKRWRE